MEELSSEISNFMWCSAYLCEKPLSHSSRYVVWAAIEQELAYPIPILQHRTNKQQANGGEVTKVEKNATYVIADHQRQDAPPGSISWNWIEQSVKNGHLEDIEEHRAGPRTKIIREVGSGQRTRAGRVPFTEEDDKVLMKWVSKAERSGLSSKGNDIYKQLEKKVC